LNGDGLLIVMDGVILLTEITGVVIMTATMTVIGQEMAIMDGTPTMVEDTIMAIIIMDIGDNQVLAVAVQTGVTILHHATRSLDRM